VQEERDLFMKAYSVLVILKYGQTIQKNIVSVDATRAIINALDSLTTSEKNKVTGVRIIKG